MASPVFYVLIRISVIHTRFLALLARLPVPLWLHKSPARYGCELMVMFDCCDRLQFRSLICSTECSHHYKKLGVSWFCKWCSFLRASYFRSRLRISRDCNRENHTPGGGIVISVRKIPSGLLRILRVSY
ncbi:hypothetical protein DKX38_029948 [Salix brachista]|uniref:Secreted protein n=1 Tax=Salix brachista TaxID=2182728 RepID=A0A5N5J3Y5_9ROSI|nr:hypothetical protein DKX38_029948 [Salix brachista]